MPEKTAILIASCDKYSDLWAPFFHCFWRNWPDCPYPVYLGSNERVWSGQRVTTLAIGRDETWSANLRKYVARIGAERIIVFLDDFFIQVPVDTERVRRLVALAYEHEVACLRLRPAKSIGPRRWPDLGRIPRGEEYRICTQVAIWDTSFLLRLAHPSFDIWQFEHYGTLLGDRLPGEVLSVYEYAIDYRHGVERGRWIDQGLKICRDAGVEPDLSVRSVISEEERAKSVRRGVKGAMRSLFPPAARRFIRRWRYRRGLRQYL